MFGMVPFEHRGVRYVATLEDDRTWSFVPSPPASFRWVSGWVLGVISGLMVGPQYGFYGPIQLHYAADFLGNPGGEVVVRGVEGGKSMPEVVY